MKIRVAMLFGGRSVEHEVSVISGIQALMNMDTEKYDVLPVYMSKQGELYVGDGVGRIEAYRDLKGLLAKSQRVIFVREGERVLLEPYPKTFRNRKLSYPVDLVFPVVHGTNVEDGTLQGFLKTLGIPFVGCDVAASALGMDKAACKAVLKERGIPVLDCLCFTTADYADIDRMADDIERQIGYPVILKPHNLGSSVGIGVARDRVGLVKAIDDAFLYSRRVIAEHAITELREINCAVLGDENAAEASECEEPLHTKDILSYEDKYMNGAKGKGGGPKGMAGVSRKIPAELAPERRAEIRDMAVRAFRALGCNGVARIDFMIDGADGRLYFNEINTIPGSLSFYLWEPLGLSYRELLERMIRLAFRRQREEEALTFAFDTNILDSGALSGAKK